MKKSKIIAAIGIIVCIFLALALINCSEQQPPAREQDRHYINPDDFDSDESQEPVRSDSVSVPPPTKIDFSEVNLAHAF